MPDERADRLAKAIEQMVQGEVPENLDDEELHELLQIARIRLDAARLAAERGNEAQASVLERVIARLELRKQSQNGDGRGAAPGSDSAAPLADQGPEHVDIRDLQDIIDLSRQLAEQAAAISETHREAVWRRVLERVEMGTVTKRGFFSWPFGGRDPEAHYFGVTMDRMVLGEPIWEAKDSRLEELLDLARHQSVAAVESRAGLAEHQARVWARLRPRLMARIMFSRDRIAAHRRVFKRGISVAWPKLAAAGGVAVLVAAAVGPIPATGLAHHPVTELVRSLGGGGVSQTDSPPDVPAVTAVIAANTVTTAEASELMDLPLHEPTFVPYGYRRASSEHFPMPLTAVDGGLFVLSYEDNAGGPERILVYQEQATGGSSIVVEQGFAQDIRLTGGSPATYVSGVWRPSQSQLRWSETSQTLLFDLAGVRTVINTNDNRLRPLDLVAIGDSLAEQALPPTN